MLESVTSFYVLLLSVLLAPLAYIIYHIVVFLREVKRIGKAVDKFPSEPKHWLWGHLHLYPGPNEKGLEFSRYLTKKYPYSGGVWRGPLLPVVVLRHPTVIADIIKTAEPKPMGMGVYRHGKPWIGEGLLLSQGKKWARNRKLLTPAFHFDILKPYIKVNNEAAVELCKKMQNYADSGKSMEVFGAISLCTFDVILRCAFSFENNIQKKGDNHPYVQAVCELGDLWVERTLKPWLYSDWIYYLTPQGRKFKKNCDFVHSISEEVISKRQQILEEKGTDVMRKGRYIDFLDILLTAQDEEGQGLSIGDIRDEVDTFMFEGHDTTASSISWALYSLAGHPDVQKRCQAEVDEVLNGKESGDIEWDDLPQLKYLTQCIKESMRLHTPVPFIERCLTKDMVIDGKTLPPGTIVAIQIYNLHHNPIVWENPMDFDPERFSPGNIEKKDNFAFLPFSAGPRNCIGQHFAMHEQKVVLARILHRFDLSLDLDKPTAKKIGVVMKTKDGMYLKINARN